MDAVDRKNVRLAVIFAAVAFVCSAILAPLFFWELVDTEDHIWAQVTYVLAVLMFVAGLFSLNAFVSVLRFGFVRERKGILHSLGALATFIFRAILAFCNVNVLWLGVLGVIDTRGALDECVSLLLFLAMIFGGYRFLYWLSKKIRTERALCVPFDET